jgi:hypothetical protein
MLGRVNLNLRNCKKLTKIGLLSWKHFSRTIQESPNFSEYNDLNVLIRTPIASALNEDIIFVTSTLTAMFLLIIMPKM